MRSRNVEFNASNLKPNTRYYQFLDNRSGVDVVPKLIEISNNAQLTGNGASAAFTIGETVVGTVNGQERIRFRLARPDHKKTDLLLLQQQYTTKTHILNLKLVLHIVQRLKF